MKLKVAEKASLNAWRALDKDRNASKVTMFHGQDEEILFSGPVEMGLRNSERDLKNNKRGLGAS